MERRQFGRTGLEVSPLGFGAAPIGIQSVDQKQAGKVLNDLLDAGVNLIDTAECYQDSELLIGEAIGHRRGEYVLVTKCGHKAPPDLEGEDWRPELIEATVDRALRRLRTDRLDVILLHSCDREVLEKGDVLEVLRKARDAGKVRWIGYSGDNETAAYAATLPDVAVIETSVNIADQANIDVVLPETQRRDIGVLAKRPIANSAWKDISDQPEAYRSYVQTYTDRLRKMAIDPAALGFSGPPEKAWPELALRFTLSQPGVHVAIIGTTNPAHLRANIEAAEKGPLPRQTIQAIRDIFQRAQSDGPWTGQT